MSLSDECECVHGRFQPACVPQPGFPGMGRNIYEAQAYRNLDLGITRQFRISERVDLLPTIGRLCNARLPDKPLDGIDVWPLLSGQRSAIEREVLLYFDDWNVQCARWGKWKLHFMRYNVPPYVPAPQEGRVNLPLPVPELYKLESDPDESYDVAPENPKIVAEIQSRVERLLEGFPEEVRKAYRETKALQVENSNVGQVPRLKKQ
jgi:arylsulfatase A